MMNGAFPRFSWCLCLVAFAEGAAFATAATPAPVLFPWERGVGLRYAGVPEADMFLWFYEWNLFEAVRPGPHSGSQVLREGEYQLERYLNAAATEASIEGPSLRLTMRSVAGGANLLLRITNQTDREWPEIATIIPCWNPGKTDDSTSADPTPANPNFADPTRTKTWYVSATGLAPLDSRAVHFNAKLRPAVERASDQGQFVFSFKWPTSEVDAAAGLLIRESEDGRWVTAIAWEDFLTIQGHNPWKCLHQGIRVGPLKPGESKTIRGKAYVFRGTKEDCLETFEKDFGPVRRQVSR